MTQDDFINWWLEKYHNTNCDEVIKLHPEWNDGNHSRDFYDAYQVSQEQHDEWYNWFIGAIKKEFRVSKKYARMHSWATYLNVAPTVKI